MSSLRPHHGERGQSGGCGSAMNDQQFGAFRQFRDSGMRVMPVAGMARHEYRPANCIMRDLIFRQRHRFEPAGERDAGGFHYGLESKRGLRKS